MAIRVVGMEPVGCSEGPLLRLDGQAREESLPFGLLLRQEARPFCRLSLLGGSLGLHLFGAFASAFFTTPTTLLCLCLVLASLLGGSGLLLLLCHPRAVPVRLCSE